MPVAAQTPVAYGGQSLLHQFEGRRHGEQSIPGAVRAAGMGVAPAGVEKPNTGHHHLLIDATVLTAEQRRAYPRPTIITSISAAVRPKPW